MIHLPFQIFGSKSSQDYDVLLLVNALPPTIDSNHALIKDYNRLLEELFISNGLPAKKVNCNLGVLKDGRLIDVFKGTYDEVNNSLYYTYDRHTQNYPQHILSPYDRTNSDFFKHLKLKRCYRFLLSFYSRVPELREDIKLALRGDFIKRLEVLTQIDFTKHTEFPKKKDKVEDIYKVIAFQLAQTLLLFNGVEIFSKEGALMFYPKLENAILRKPLTEYDLVELNILLYQLLVVGSQEVTKMENLNEEIFGQ
jgi:hypothetical protein